jgi:hypothetical protein
MLTNLAGMIPSGFAVAVMEKAAELFDLELPGQAVDHTSRHIREVFQEGAQKASRAELNGEPQPVVVASMRANQAPITVIQVEVTGQLFRA